MSLRVKRVPWKERYFYTVPSEEFPWQWLVSTICLLESSMACPDKAQDVAHALDFGPIELGNYKPEAGNYGMSLGLPVTRRTKNERYFTMVPALQWPTGWMTSVLGMAEVILDNPGMVTMQDIADALDYGPNRLSPRQYQEFTLVKDAFDRAITEADANCKRGEHSTHNGSCLHCGHKESHLKVVENT